MQFYLAIAAAVALLAQESVSQDVRISSLRSYANKLKSSSAGSQCELPDEVAGSVEMKGCSKSFYFTKAEGTDTKCVHNGGSTRTNGSFSDVGSAEDCANKCVEDESKVNKIVGMNYSCAQKTCQCLFGGGSVEGTAEKSGSTCYAVTAAASSTYQLPNGEKMSRYCGERSQFEIV